METSDPRINEIASKKLELHQERAGLVRGGDVLADWKHKAVGFVESLTVGDTEKDAVREHVDARVKEIVDQAVPEFREAWSKKTTSYDMDGSELIVPLSPKFHELEKQWEEVGQLVKDQHVKGPEAELTSSSLETVSRLGVAKSIDGESKALDTKLSQIVKNAQGESHALPAESHGEAIAAKA